MFLSDHLFDLLLRTDESHLLYCRHNDLAWNLRKFVHNKLEKVNLSTNIKYLEPWSVSK